MSFLVLCPRCRHQVSVQESMIGQPAKCPYCTMPFRVPAPPRPAPLPFPRANAMPKPPRPERTASRSRRIQPDPTSEHDFSPEPQRSARTLVLGLVSAGIVVLLLAGLFGTVYFFSRDQTPSSPTQARRETAIAQADPRPANKTVLQQPSKKEPPQSATPVDKPPRPIDGAAPQSPPLQPIGDKRQAEKPPSSKQEQVESKPSRREAIQPDSPAKEETPKPPPSAQKEATSKPGPPPKAKTSPKVEAPRPDPSEKEEMAQGKPAPRTEPAKGEDTTSPLPARRRLSGAEIFHRLVKSCVYVRNRDGWGSGSLIHKERKLILTNYHVVGEHAEVHVSFPRYDSAGKLIVDGAVYERAYKLKELIHGKVLKIAKGQDLALVELDTVPDGTPALKLAPRSASPGQAVHSVGNTGVSDARWQYTSGTVRQLSHKTWRASGGGGKIHSFDADILETQSPTNPGDSGGPLVNEALQLVGVTQGADVSARELSFFIDVSEVKKLLQAADVDLKDVMGSADDVEGGIVESGDIFILAKCLDDKDAKVRSEAARRLAELGPQARQAARPLKKALRDEEPLVRQSAALALGKLGPGARDLVRKDVFKAVQDADADVRMAALEALANLGAPDLAELPILLSLLRGAVEKQDSKICLPIARSLALLGPRAKDAVPDLREMLKAEDRSIRAAVVSALRKIGPAARDAAPELSELLKDNDPNLRMQAALALTAIDPALTGAGKDALSVLVKALRPASSAENDGGQAKERIKELSAVLVKVGEPAVERLLRAIESDFRRGRARTEAATLDAVAREAALKIIAEMGPAAHSSRTIAALAELQRTDPSRAVREAARQAYIAIQDSK